MITRNQLISINPENHYNVWTDQHETLKKTLYILEDLQPDELEDFLTGDDYEGVANRIIDYLVGVYTEDHINWLANKTDHFNHFVILEDYINRLELKPGEFNLSNTIMGAMSEYYSDILHQEVKPLLYQIVKDQEGGTK